MIQHDLTDMGPTREIDLPQLQLQGMKRKDGGISIHETQILKCTISHCRLFPKKHRFAYAYLSVGIPVRSPTSNWLLSVDDVSWWQKGWFHVSPQDHLARGRHGATLSQNLDEYLKHQGLNPTDFPHVYLLTAPRFLNYVFSPASFWYLFGKKEQLMYVIAEVNNTFDERRMYLFRAPERPGPFRQTLDKDFHVSPFSSRKGSYLLSSSDPAGGENISVAVTLRSSKGHPKLVARWWSDEPAIDPASLSVAEVLHLLIFWGLNILTTFPKIVFNAVLLSHVHKLEMWYRPEPKVSALGRQPNSAEKFVAYIFTQYVHHLGGLASDKASIVERVPTSGSLLHLDIGQQKSSSEEKATTDLRVHTPQFFRQLITYQKLSDYLSYMLLRPYEENRTAWSDDSPALVTIVEAGEAARAKREIRRPSMLVSRMLFVMYGYCRCKQPLYGQYPDLGVPSRRKAVASPGEGEGEKEPRRISGGSCCLDDFVLENCGIATQARYVAAVLGLQWRARIMSLIGGE